MKLINILIALIIFININVFAEEASTEATDNSSCTLVLGQDPSFGFYPSIYGSFGLKENLSFTYYGVFWTSPQTGTAALPGLNLLTEMGVGLSFSLADGAFAVSPSLGLAHGVFQSGSKRPVFADNIVPSLTLAYYQGKFSASTYAIYWLASRNEGPTQYDLLEYNLQCAYDVSKRVNLGLFFDYLMITTKMNDESETASSYMWLGPSIKFTVKNTNLWFSTGLDLIDYINKDVQTNDKKIKEYYKLTTSFTF